MSRRTFAKQDSEEFKIKVAWSGETMDLSMERRGDAVQSCSNNPLNVPTSYDTGRVAPTEGSEDITRFEEFWNASEKRDPRAACILTVLSTVPRPRSNMPAVRLAQIQGYLTERNERGKDHHEYQKWSRQNPTMGL